MEEEEELSHSYRSSKSLRERVGLGVRDSRGS